MEKTLLKQIKSFIGVALFICCSTIAYGQANCSSCTISGTTASAMGFQTTASGSYSVAIGQRSIASGHASFASGYWSEASGSRSIALGERTEATGDQAIAWGERSKATGDHSLAYGSYVDATVLKSMIFGTGAGTNRIVNNIENSLMIGFNSTIPTVFVGPASGVGTLGKVGIGTTNTPTTVGGANISDYTLFVKGGILTEEIRVKTGWADYVFDENYQLTSLEKVEEYIQQNGHLPNVPSEKEVVEQGLEIGEITKIQQEKIEELTLYIIEMQKQIDELKLKLD